MRFLEFIFQSFWHFSGFVILLYLIGEFIESIIRLIKQLNYDKKRQGDLDKDSFSNDKKIN